MCFWDLTSTSQVHVTTYDTTLYYTNFTGGRPYRKCRLSDDWQIGAPQQSDQGCGWWKYGGNWQLVSWQGGTTRCHRGNVLCAVMGADGNASVFMWRYAPCSWDASSMMIRLRRCYSSTDAFVNVLGKWLRGMTSDRDFSPMQCILSLITNVLTSFGMS